MLLGPHLRADIGSRHWEQTLGADIGSRHWEQLFAEEHSDVCKLEGNCMIDVTPTYRGNLGKMVKLLLTLL